MIRNYRRERESYVARHGPTRSVTALVYGLLGIAVRVIAVRLLVWATRINVGETIEVAEFRPVSVVVAAAHIGLGLVVAGGI